MIRRLLATTRRIDTPRTRRAARRSGRVMAIVAVALLGSWIGLLVGGQTTSPIGPVEARLSLRPALTGETVINIAPLGSLSLDSHDGPLRLRVAVDQIRPDSALRLIKHPPSLEAFGDHVASDLRSAVTKLALKSAASMLLGATLLAVLVFRRWRRSALTSLVALLAVGGTFAASTLTFSPSSIAEPRYRGLLSSAPSVVGSAQSIVENFSQYSAQLAELVTNVSELYGVTSTLPTYEPDPNTVRVLHVSDIHLNPAAWGVIRSISKQFKVDVIVDTGDMTDFGSEPEERFVQQISDIGVPYVFVRGNHDSDGTQEAVADQEGTVVLDNEAETVAGLTFYGVGDPRFTPDSAATQKYTPGELRAFGRRYARQLRWHKPSVDVALVHGPAVARGFDGTVPLVLSGHTHNRSTKLLPRGTRRFVQGSTGGAGLRGLNHSKPTPLQLSVLYFDRKTDKLQAWDNITVGGLGLTSARIQRHISPEPDRKIGPPSPNRAPAPSPAEPTSSTPTSTPGVALKPEGVVPYAVAVPGGRRHRRLGRPCPHRPEA